MKTELVLNERSFTLYRFPKRSNETLQAWDAGDEYLLNHLDALNIEKGKHILVINDSFGALSCALSGQYKVTMMSDSFISHQGTKANLTLNNCAQIDFKTTMDDVPNQVDLVLFQLPKSNRHLTWILSQLHKSLNANVPVIAVNKAKEIHSSTLKLFERFLGTTTTSLAWKKHRLVFGFADHPSPKTEEIHSTWPVDKQNFQLKNRANVYSGDRLDLGARFILDHLPEAPELTDFIDLGCGNGVLSVKMGQLHPHAKITCVDESYMAVSSAEENLREALGDQREIRCVVNNCLDGFAPQSASMVICNPPFHQQQAITDHIAWQMFCDAKHVLRKGGKLLVIGNRHLGYDVKLVRLFGKTQVERVAQNKKFVILQATK